MPRLSTSPARSRWSWPVLAAVLAMPASAQAPRPRRPRRDRPPRPRLLRSTPARRCRPPRRPPAPRGRRATRPCRALLGARASATSAACSGSAPREHIGLTGDLNNICSPSLPEPEPANSGIDAMVAPPASRQAAEDALRRGRRGRGLLGRHQPAVLGHDVADRQQRRGHRLRRGQVARPGHDHGVPVGGGQRHPELAEQRHRQADHQPGQRHLLPVPGRGRHPRRDLAGLAGPDPQARHPDHRGHDLDGGGRRRRRSS